MNRKTREERRELKAVDEYHEYFRGATDDGIKYMMEFIQFYDNFMSHAAYNLSPDLMNYVIYFGTWDKYLAFVRQSLQKRKSKIDKGVSSIIHYLPLFHTEAARKGFDSILTYVHFLKLTFLEENGVYRIVRENEQRYIKQWVHMKKNFRKKWAINIEIETPLSTHVFEI